MLDTSTSSFAIKDIPEILDELGSTNQGLTSNEAYKRLKADGYNSISSEKKTQWIVKYLKNYLNPLILILLFAASTSYILGDSVASVIITSIVVFSATLNFFQEYHASRAAAKLKERVATYATVTRDGKEEDIPVSHVCIGDIITLSAGDLVPADARILSSNDFFVNQASLTGESFPVEKSSNKIEARDTSLTSLTNVVFAGSNVVTGIATAVVFKTGKQTTIGTIAEKISITPPDSEFTKSIKSFSFFILRITILFVLFIFFFNSLVKQQSFLESFTFAIAIAVGLTPELLPMIMSVTMAKGSLYMAKKGVIVKKLAAIPNFGSMDILCTDKTGTLTEGKIELVQYLDALGKHSENVLLHAYVNSSFQTGIKNPMDDAVLRYKHEDIKNFKKIDEIPFDFVRKRMSVIAEKGRKRFIITKGAPEEVFHVCSSYLATDKEKELNTKGKEKITKIYHELSEQGYRVVAIARKQIENHRDVYNVKDEANLTFLGFIAFLDPAKKDIRDVLTQLKNMYIEVKVITGDNELVTKKICEEVGLEVKGILLGHKLDTLNDDALKIAVQNITIFARFSPDQKNRIITALKANNHVIGYMGDGINDAPSLQAADVGISVNNAVDVAKESADFILTHKSLRVLKDGVLEGRKTFGNTMKYIMMGISANFGNMFSVLGAVFLVPFLPMLPTQILFNNLLYDTSQLTIPTDSVDNEYLQTPKRWNIHFVRDFMIVFGLVSSLFDFITFFFLRFVFHASEHMFQTGWFLESLATQTLVIYVIRTRKLPFIQSRPSLPLLLSTSSVVTIGWLIPFTPLGAYFNFTALPMNVLFVIVLIVIANLLVAELVKDFFYKKYRF